VSRFAKFSRFLSRFVSRFAKFSPDVPKSGKSGFNF
jgi:hypothetical protein